MFLKTVSLTSRMKITHMLSHRFISSLLMSSLALGSLTLLTGCDSSESDKVKRKAKEHLVETVEVAFDTASIQRTQPGTLQANREVKITTQTQGVLKELAVYPGDQVKAGDTLARIDDALINAEVNKASATLKQAEIDLKRLKNLAPRKLASESDIAQGISGGGCAGESSRVVWEVEFQLRGANQPGP